MMAEWLQWEGRKPSKVMRGLEEPRSAGKKEPELEMAEKGKRRHSGQQQVPCKV